MPMISTRTTINTSRSLLEILETHFPLVAPSYYTPRKDDGVIYEHVPFNATNGTRAVICHFDDALVRDRENAVLNDLFNTHYAMTFDEAMATINLTFTTEVI